MSAAHQIETFRIVGAAVQKPLERVTPVRILAGGNIGGANFAPDFVLSVKLIALHDLLEMADGVARAGLGARDASQLIMRILLVRIDVDGAMKTLARFVQFTALLMNQPEIVVRG